MEKLHPAFSPVSGKDPKEQFQEMFDALRRLPRYLETRSSVLWPWKIVDYKEGQLVRPGAQSLLLGQSTGKAGSCLTPTTAKTSCSGTRMARPKGSNSWPAKHTTFAERPPAPTSRCSKRMRKSPRSTRCSTSEKQTWASASIPRMRIPTGLKSSANRTSDEHFRSRLTGNSSWKQLRWLWRGRAGHQRIWPVRCGNRRQMD